VGSAQGDGCIAGIENAVDRGSAGVELPRQGGHRQAVASQGRFESGNESFFGESLAHWPMVYQIRCSIKVSQPWQFLDRGQRNHMALSGTTELFTTSVL